MSDTAVPAPKGPKAQKPEKAGTKAVTIAKVRKVKAVPAPDAVKRSPGRPAKADTLAARQTAMAVAQRHYKTVAPYQDMSIAELLTSMPAALANQRNPSLKQAWVLYVTGAQSIGLSAKEAAEIRAGVLKLTGMDISIPFGQTAPDPAMTGLELVCANLAYTLGTLGEALIVTKEATLKICADLVLKGVFAVKGHGYVLTDIGDAQLRKQQATESSDEVRHEVPASDDSNIVSGDSAEATPVSMVAETTSAQADTGAAASGEKRYQPELN